MLTKAGRIKCDNCGKIISYEDLNNRKATHNYVLYSQFSKETYLSFCKRCVVDTVTN